MPQMAKAENTRRTYRIVVRVARQTCLNPLLAAGADVAAILVSKRGRGLTPGQAPPPPARGIGDGHQVAGLAAADCGGNARSSRRLAWSLLTACPPSPRAR
jgi:hypothetical protein